MKVCRWILVPVVSVLALGLTGGVSTADNGATPTTRLAAAEKPAKKTAGKTPQLSAKAVEDLEKLSGKPLTDEQKQQLIEAIKEKSAAIKAANNRFHEQKAKILGMTDAELKAKEKELRAKQRAEKKAKAAGG